MELAVQAETFGILALTGILLGFLFDCYRVLRLMYRPRGFVTGFADLCYWLIATLIAGGALLYSNWGEMRLYVIRALIVGFGGYFKLLSRYAIELIIHVLRGITRVLHWTTVCLYQLIGRPFSYAIRLLCLVFSPFIRCMKKLNRFFDDKKEEPPV